MRSVLILTSALLICLVGSTAMAQVTARASNRSSDPAANQSEQTKNAVEQTVEESKKKGEVVLVRCLEDCGDNLVSDDVITGQALELPPPSYPAIARAAHASGKVSVQILIDVDGSVIAAASVSGHPLLQAAAVEAARHASFSPTTLKGEPVKVTGIISYHFMIQ